MSQLRQDEPRSRRPVLLGLAALALIGAATLTNFLYRPSPSLSPAPSPTLSPALPGAPPSVPAPSAAPARPQEQSAETRPSAAPESKPGFDIVRVSPQGQAVIAGTAAPDQTVVIRDGAKELGRTTADAAGQWVLVPDQPLAPGAQELNLAARRPDGSEQQAEGSVLLVVPDRGPAGKPAPAGPQTALAVLTPKAAPGDGGGARVLQAPQAGSQTAAPDNGTPAAKPAAAAHLDLDVFDYDDHGALRFSGHAPAGTRLRLYVDNAPAGEVVADGQARWTGTPSGIAPGQHQVRVDQLDEQGRVTRRVELPFMRESLPEQAVAAGEVVVQPRATLWRLARKVYGQGIRYTVIYAYNSDIIRDPNRIYPGQVFRIPDAAAAATVPSAK